MKRRNLEKAIIMSIALISLSNGCLVVDAMTSSEFEEKYKDENSNSYIVTGNVKVENDSQAQIGDSTWNTINVMNGATLDLENVSFAYKPTITGDGNITINLTDVPAGSNNQYVFKTGADITANSLTVINSSSDDGKGMAADENSVVLNVKEIYIKGQDDGIYQSGSRGANGNGIDISGFDKITLIGEKGYGLVTNSADGAQIIGNKDSEAWFKSEDSSIVGGRAAIGNRGEGNVTVEAAKIILKGNSKGVYAQNGSVTLTADKSTVDGKNIIAVVADRNAVYSDGGDIELNADTNIVVGGNNGIVAELHDSDIDITGNTNIIGANSDTGELLRSLNEDNKLIYGDQTVIWAAAKAANEGKNNVDDNYVFTPENTPELNVNISAETKNLISGAIRAENNANITVQTTGNTEGGNYILSSAHGKDNEHIVAAVYAKDRAAIDIKTGENGVNYIATDFDFVHEDDDSERTVWAQRGGVINITGTTVIKSSNSIGDYENGFATNSRGIAITAGSGDTDAVIPDGVRSTVNIEYGPEVKIDGETFSSAIYGDIAAGYGGTINIAKISGNSEYGLYVEGNALAANGGTLDMNLGEGGTWYGRADDYQDAGEHGHGEEDDNGKSFFNPVFSNEITSAGTVNVTLGKCSQWFLTGQSWITSVTGVSGEIGDAEKPVIDIANSNVWLGDVTSTALTIGTLKGNVRFNMHLDGNELSKSDMLYIKNAQGEYDINLNEAVTNEEINNGHDGLRFATVGKGSNAEFRVGTYDKGIFNVQYEVGTDLYADDPNNENEKYNGSSLDEHKPGDSAVDDFFEDKDAEIMTLDEIAEADTGLDETTNFKIIGRLDEDISDGGKTVVNMSKVNYSNAVYMDRLNKRLGEARYINTEEDQGMWVRMRHDRIGKDNEFRIMNTMYELGYDEKQECDNGERRVGAAIDYMDGSSEYTGVGGSGDVSRKGIWLYDTWLGDKGHYSDFVAKWGHLSNDFTLYRGGDKITGDFSNDVYSISAEYGRKKDIGNNWYFEPQVQLQYARVTDANYITSQGTEVSLDAINSLIARAGFRLGKDLGERSTVYFKADLLHEFLGDQDIAARDKTTDGKWTNVTYGNEGTWCDIGFGFATAMSKTSYAYLDVETSLGNDYEETYQINAGLQWSF